MGQRGMLRFLGNRLVELVLVVLLITFIPNIPPNAKYSKSYKVPSPQPLEGKLALNERLHNVELWHKGDFVGPEAFAEYNGELYTTVHGGDVVKLTGDHITPVVKFGKPCKGIYQERLCGRPLGIHFDKNGALFVADAYYGIFKVDVKTGKKLQLVSPDNEIDGKKSKLFNSIALASNGDIYWTDSSTEFSLEDGFFDLFADGSGRLVHYDAKMKTNKVLLSDLHFANGLMLSEDESFLIVAETFRNRVHRYYLKGPKKGTSDLFLDGLPGLPDNIQSDGQNGFLIPLVVPVDKQHPLLATTVGPFPLLRKFISRLFGIVEVSFKLVDQIYPNEVTERAIHYIGHFTSFSFLKYDNRTTILQVNKNGEILNCLHAVNTGLKGISEAFVYKNHLLLGSPFNDYIGRISLDEAGLSHLATDKTVKKPVPTQSAEKIKTAEPTPTPAPVKKQPPTTKTPKVVQQTASTKQANVNPPSSKENTQKATTASPTITESVPSKPSPKQVPVKDNAIPSTKKQERPTTATPVQNQQKPSQVKDEKPKTDSTSQENSAKKVPPSTTINSNQQKKSPPQTKDIPKQKTPQANLPKDNTINEKVKSKN